MIFRIKVIKRRWCILGSDMQRWKSRQDSGEDVDKRFM